VKDILKGLANNTKNPAFNQALDNATKNRQGNEDYLVAFYNEWDKVSNGTKLASPEIFSNRLMGDDININMTDAQVKKVIDRKVDESITSAFEVLNKRIDKFGVVQPNIQRLGQSGRILVELPGAKDVDRIKKLLSGTAQLEFWETYKAEEMNNFLLAANEALKASEMPAATEAKDTAKTDTTKSEEISKLLGADKSKDSTATAKQSNGPLLDKIIGMGGGP